MKSYKNIYRDHTETYELKINTKKSQFASSIHTKILM